MTLGQRHKTHLQTNLDRVKHLPEPEVEFTQMELHDRLESVFDRLASAGIIEHVGYTGTDHNDSHRVKVWSVDHRAYDHVQHLLENRDDTSAPALPCSDHGFVNEGDAIACKFDDCDGAWSKADLRHFWEHGQLPGASPDTVECDACGGVADRLPSSGEVLDDVTMHYYSCRECSEGGHIEEQDDEKRRVGPVFEGARYNQYGDQRGVPADD